MEDIDKLIQDSLELEVDLIINPIFTPSNQSIKTWINAETKKGVMHIIDIRGWGHLAEFFGFNHDKVVREQNKIADFILFWCNKGLLFRRALMVQRKEIDLLKKEISRLKGEKYA